MPMTKTMEQSKSKASMPKAGRKRFHKGSVEAVMQASKENRSSPEFAAEMTQTMKEMDEDDAASMKAVEEVWRQRRAKKTQTQEEWDAAMKSAPKNENTASRDAWMYGFGVWAGDPEELKRLEAEVMKMREESD